MIILPWPDKLLNPNARGHWAPISKVKKTARHRAAIETALAKEKVDWDGPIYLWVTFYPPDKRKRDDDNVFAMFKAYRDGIADALKVNDNRFKFYGYLHEDVVKGGRVEVTITSGPTISSDEK